MHIQEIFKFNYKNRTMLELGSKLYPNTKWILYEYISNSYDANANDIWISINSKEKFIKIEDNGEGMNLEEIQDNFLTVGSDNKRLIPKMNKRLPIGKKGLGRLSVVGIAKIMKLYTKKDNDKEYALSISLEGIEQNKDDVITKISDTQIQKNGTIIYIEEIKFDFKFFLENIINDIYLNFYPIIINKNIDFNIWIKVNEESNFHLITSDYKTLIEDIEYLTPINLKNDILINNQDLRLKHICELNKVKKIMNFNYFADGLTFDGNLKQIKLDIYGWIGLVKDAKSIKTKENVFENKIYVYARNRLVEENIPILSRHNYRYNIVGIIFCEELDKDGFHDIIQTNRSGISESDNRVSILSNFINIISNNLIYKKQENVSKITKEKNKKEFKQKEILINKIVELSKQDTSSEEFKKQLFKIHKSKNPIDNKQIFISYKYNDYSHSIAKFLNKIFKFINNLIDEHFEVNFLDDEDGKRVNNGKSIMGWIQKNVYSYPENLSVIVCLTKGYVDNWNTDIEYGAAWGLGKEILYVSDERLKEGEIDWRKSPITKDTKLSYFKDLKLNTKNIEIFVEDIILVALNQIKILLTEEHKKEILKKISNILNEKNESLNNYIPTYA